MAAPTVLRHQAEQLAANLPPLLVAAQRVASTVAQGVHGRRRVGQGETFWQFRGYESGDAPQLIDWRQSAKADRVFVRELEWEAAQTVWLWRDRSDSMAWQSDGALPTKRERADLLTLALAVLMIGAGEHVGLLGHEMRPAHGRSGLSRLSTMMSRDAAGDLAQAPASDEALSRPPLLPLPRHAQLVMMGDFLTPLEELARLVDGYAARGLKGHLLQILDPAEEDLPYEGRVRFESVEAGEAAASGDWLLPRVESARPEYRRRFLAHCEGLSLIARKAGWTYTRHRSDRPAQGALLGLYMALSEPRGL